MERLRPAKYVGSKALDAPQLIAIGLAFRGGHARSHSLLAFGEPLSVPLLSTGDGSGKRCWEVTLWLVGQGVSPGFGSRGVIQGVEQVGAKHQRSKVERGDAERTVNGVKRGPRSASATVESRNLQPDLSVVRVLLGRLLKPGDGGIEVACSNCSLSFG
jgi:hypothetical protein